MATTKRSAKKATKPAKSTQATKRAVKPPRKASSTPNTRNVPTPAPVVAVQQTRPGVPRSQRGIAAGTKSIDALLVTPRDIAATLTVLEANPNSPALIEDAQADIAEFGLDAFFEALPQTPSAQRAAAVETAKQQLEAAQAPIEKDLELVAGDKGVTHATWKDCIGSRVVQPLCIFHPTTLAELQSVLKQATQNQCRVKAVGSGHSFTDVATTTDFLIETHGLNHPLDIEANLLKPAVDTRTLFATECGIRIRDLNEELWNRGLGLINMGGYDGQTIMGVVSTSTHGSGIEFGPLADGVVSLTTVVADGRTIRIEPSDGITDAAKWKAAHPEIELVQDDDWFYACQVGIGCMGVVYSLVMRVRERYWMLEQRTLNVWSQVKRDLQDGKLLRDNRHCEVLVNPYWTNGDHTCLITCRNPANEPTERDAPRPQRSFLLEMFAKFRGTGAILLQLLNRCPDLVPTVTDKALEGLAREYLDRSYRVFNIGAANDVPGYGSEIGFPMSTYIAAVDRILEITAHAQRLGKTYLTSPLSLRFVKASKAYMSMMHDSDTCMIEFPMLDNTFGGRELLRRIEDEMYAFGGRPHWGLLNFLSGGQGLIEEMYPMFPRWLNIFNQLNTNGMFENAFTERCGFVDPRYTR